MTKIKRSIRKIIKTITSDKKLFDIFYFKTKNRKYKVRELLRYILDLLKVYHIDILIIIITMYHIGLQFINFT